MRRALTCGLAVIYALGALSSVFAVEMTDDTQTIRAEYTIGATYSVTIPANIVFGGFNDAQEVNISASDVLLHNRESLRISMTSENGALVNEDSSIPYTLKIGDGEVTAINSTDTYNLLSVEAGDIDGDSVAVTFTSGDDTNVTLSGLHADTLTFSVRPEIASLAGTTWKFNDILVDIDAMGSNLFDYEEQELSFVVNGYMNPDSDFEGDVWGFDYTQYPFGDASIEYFSQVGTEYIYIYFPTFTWIDGNEYSGWVFGDNDDIRSFFDGDMDIDTIGELLLSNFGIDAPTMYFTNNQDDDSHAEDPDFIDWMYKNATLIDTEVLE